MIHVDPALIDPPPVPAAAPAPPGAPASARALIEGQMAMLTRLAQIGMELAEACGREAKCAAAAEPAAPVPMHDPGLVFARVARAVRMTIALQSRLLKDLAALDKQDAWTASSRRSQRRMRLGDLVHEAAEVLVTTRRAAERPLGGPDWDERAVEAEIEQMSAVAYERLIDAEDGRLMGRSFDVVLADICRDLGLTPERTARLLATVEPPGGSQPEPPAARPPDPDPDPQPPPGPAWAGPAAPPRAPP